MRNRYAITFRCTYIVQVNVLSENPDDAKQKAEKLLSKWPPDAKNVSIIDGRDEYAGWSNDDLWDVNQ